MAQHPARDVHYSYAISSLTTSKRGQIPQESELTYQQQRILAAIAHIQRQLSQISDDIDIIRADLRAIKTTCQTSFPTAPKPT